MRDEGATLKCGAGDGMVSCVHERYPVQTVLLLRVDSFSYVHRPNAAVQTVG